VQFQPGQLYVRKIYTIYFKKNLTAYLTKLKRERKKEEKRKEKYLIILKITFFSFS